MNVTERPTVYCVSSFFVDHGGGVERVAHELAEYLSGTLAWPVTLAAHRTGTDSPSSPSFKVHVLRGWNGLERHIGVPLIVPHPGDVWSALRRCRSADLVVVHDVIYVTNVFCLLHCILSRTPVAVIKHTGVLPFRGGLARALQGIVNAWFLRPLTRRASLTVFVTEAKRRRYDPNGALARSRVIENGIDTTVFSLAQDVRREPNRVCFVGRFIDRKGMTILARLVRMMPETPFDLVGWGPVDPRAWGAANVTVHWCPDRTHIARVYQAARLTLFPGVSEGIALTVLESLACGTPVLVNEQCGSPDPALNGVLMRAPLDLDDPDGTAEAWSRRIRDILQDPLPETEAAALSRIVEHRYAWATVGDRYARAFQELLTARNRS